MKINMKFIRNLCVTTLLLVPALSNAESNFQTGAGALTATGKLDFSITIPKALYIRIGTGANLANLATVDLINFTVPAANIGNGTPVAGTGGDLTNGTVTCLLYTSRCV